MNYKQTSLLVGFFIWLIATIIFRVAGQHFFLTDNIWVMSLLYLITAPFLAFVAIVVYKKYQLSAQECVVASVYMVISGMFLDVFCIQFFAWVFPNMPIKADASFGAWLMWAYASVLLTGVLKGMSYFSRV